MLSVIGRILYFIGGVIVGLLSLRFLFVLLGANPANSFVNFIYTTSLPFAQPFFSIFRFEPSYGAAHFEVGTLIAIVVFGILTALVAGLFRSYGNRVYHV